MSRNISVFIASPETKDVVELAQQMAAILGTELVESIGDARCPFAFWEQLDDELSLQCFVCDMWKDDDMTDLTLQTYHYHLSMRAYEYKPGTVEEAHIRCGRFVFDKLKATNKYDLLLVLDFGIVIEEFAPKLPTEESSS